MEPSSGDHRDRVDHVDRIRADWARERPEVDTSPMDVVGRLHRVGLALTARLEERYAESGLAEPEFDLLATLRRVGAPYERAAGDLAEHTMVTSGGLTKRVDRLVARGYVVRTTGTDDARRRMVRLTPAGFEVIDRAYTAHIANERRLVDLLSPTDATRLEAILRRWLTALEE